MRAKLRGGDHTRGKVGNLQGTLNFDWLSDEDERGDYVFVFESGTTVRLCCFPVHAFSYKNHRFYLRFVPEE